MLPQIVQLRDFHHSGGHILVLDTLVGEDGGGQTAVQVHIRQPRRILRGDGVIALPEGLQFLTGHPLQSGFQPLCVR